jgi:hypothetical protein
MTPQRRGINKFGSIFAGDSETAKRRTAKAMGIGTDEALSLVHKPLGPFNWALFEIDGTAINLWDAGSLGVMEMNQLMPTVCRPHIIGVTLSAAGILSWCRIISSSLCQPPSSTP